MGLTPADFDGDGGMDVLVLAQALDRGPDDPTLDAFVLWGDHEYKDDGKHKIMCPEMSLKKGEQKFHLAILI